MAVNLMFPHVLTREGLRKEEDERTVRFSHRRGAGARCADDAVAAGAPGPCTVPVSDAGDAPTHDDTVRRGKRLSAGEPRLRRRWRSHADRPEPEESVG